MTNHNENLILLHFNPCLHIMNQPIRLIRNQTTVLQHTVNHKWHHHTPKMLLVDLDQLPQIVNPVFPVLTHHQVDKHIFVNKLCRKLLQFFTSSFVVNHVHWTYQNERRASQVLLWFVRQIHISFCLVAEIVVPLLSFLFVKLYAVVRVVRVVIVL